ncbi:ferredoxin [Actinophytocola sp.]|uniref:ferredoxin n=1 Tax=Actinophytocola sp. TaxID=1872138 RepID=UPI003899D94C
MKVWVERALCQGSELCIEASGAVFATDDAYVSFVKLADEGAPAASADHAVVVPDEHQDGVRVAAQDCPAQCIRIVE